MANRLLELLGLTTISEARELAAKAQQRVPDWFGAYATANEYNVPDPEKYTYQADLMQKIVYLYTAVTLTANSASAQDFDVYQGESEVTNSALERLLKAPNPYQTGYEFLRDHFAYKLLTGGSYWWLNAASENAEPTEIWIIPPGNIKPVPDESFGISGYLYYPGDGQEIPIPAWQIVWFRGFHPSNMYASMSAVTPLSQTMATDIDTQRFLRTVYGPNSGRLPGIIAFKSPLNDNDWRQIKRDVQKSSTERNYLMLRGVGDGVTWLQAAGNLNEMQVYQGRQMTKTDIFNAIAPGLINMTSENATEANAKTGKQTFAEFTLYPLLVDTSQKINKELSTRFGGVTLEFDDPRDLKASADAAAMALETQRAGVFSAYANRLPVSLAAQLAGLELPAGVQFAQLDAPTPEPVQPAAQAQIDDGSRAIAEELAKWETFAGKRFGKSAREFECKYIPAALALRINAGLSAAKSADDIPGIFADATREIGAVLLAQAISAKV